MTDPRQITLNLDHVMDILRKGVRRADVFMGIGLNAATQTPPVSHLLTTEGTYHINLVKGELTQEEQAHVAAEFGKWVRANGLRELIETFSIFSNRLYLALFLMHQGANHQRKEIVPTARFEQLGIIDKVDVLSELIAVDDGDRRVLRSLNQARNCYAHRQGIVGPRDLDSRTQLMAVRWNAFQVEVKEPDGNVVLEPEMLGRVFEQGGMVQLRVIERTREFAAGTELALEKQDLKEICLSALNIGRRLLHQTLEVARAAGMLKESIDESLNEPKAI